jgi:hypothetical protein
MHTAGIVYENCIQNFRISKTKKYRRGRALKFSSTNWNIMDYTGIYWNILEYTGIYWLSRERGSVLLVFNFRVPQRRGNYNQLIKYKMFKGNPTLQI